MAKPDKIEKNLAHAQGDTPEELVKLREWWNAHGNQVTIALLVVLAVVLGVRWYNSHQESRRAAAAASLATAAGRADEAGIGLAYGHPDAAQLDDAEAALEGVIAEGNSQTAPLARLRLAALRFSRGRHDLAAADYEALLAESPSPDFAALARIGLAHCAEAAGRFEEAAGLFRSFRADLPSSHLANDALLGEARCLILQGTDASRQEARELLGDFLIDVSGDSEPSPWAAFAQELISDADRLVPPARPAADVIGALLTPAEDLPAPPADEPAPPAVDEAPAAEPAAETEPSAEEPGA